MSATGKTNRQHVIKAAGKTVRRQVRRKPVLQVTSFTIVNRSAVPRRAIVSGGLPLSKGLAREVDELAITTAAGQSVPFQGQVLQRSDDGSIRFLGVDLVAELGLNEVARFTLQKADIAAPAVVKAAFAHASGNTFEIGNEHFTLRLDAQDFQPLGQIKGFASSGSASQLFVPGLTMNRKVKATVLAVGPLRAEIRVDGEHLDADGRRAMSFILVYRVLAGISAMFLDHTFIHTDDRPADKHLSELRLDFEFDLLRDARREVVQLYTDHDATPRNVTLEGRGDLSLGRRNKLYIYGGDAELDDPTPLAWSQPMHALFERYAREVLPLVRLRGGQKGVTLRFESMKLHRPKSLHCQGRTLSAGIWPVWAGSLNVPQGFAKTHRLALGFWHDAPEPVEAQIKSAFTHLRIVQESAIFRQEKLMDQHLLLPYQPKEHPFTECCWQGALRISWPEGFIHWGDTYASSYRHGHVYHGLDYSDHVYLNNEYDLLLALCQEYVRTGYGCYYEGAAAMAQHICDIDVFHHSNPYQVMKGAMRAHGLNHMDRTGFPSHQWVEGLLAFYQLSGNPRMLEIACMIGDNWVVWINERWQFMEGRDKWWALIGLSALTEVTGEERFLQNAKTTFQRLCEEMEKMTSPQWKLSFATWGLAIFMSSFKRYHQVTGDPTALLWLEKMSRIALDTRSAEGILPTVIYHPPGLIAHQFFGQALSYLDYVRPQKDLYQQAKLTLQLSWRGTLLNLGNWRDEYNQDGKPLAILYRSLMYSMGWAWRRSDMKPFEEISAGRRLS